MSIISLDIPSMSPVSQCPKYIACIPAFPTFSTVNHGFKNPSLFSLVRYSRKVITDGLKPYPRSSPMKQRWDWHLQTVPSCQGANMKKTSKTYPAAHCIPSTSQNTKVQKDVRVQHQFSIQKLRSFGKISNDIWNE